MSPDRAQKLAPLINAIANGQTVQVLNRMNKWVDTTNIALDRNIDHYRIKPSLRRYWITLDPNGNPLTISLTKPATVTSNDLEVEEILRS